MYIGTSPQFDIITTNSHLTRKYFVISNIYYKLTDIGKKKISWWNLCKCNAPDGSAKCFLQILMARWQLAVLTREMGTINYVCVFCNATNIQSACSHEIGTVWLQAAVQPSQAVGCNAQVPSFLDCLHGLYKFKGWKFVRCKLSIGADNTWLFFKVGSMLEETTFTHCLQIFPALQCSEISCTMIVTEHEQYHLRLLSAVLRKPDLKLPWQRCQILKATNTLRKRLSNLTCSTCFALTAPTSVWRA